MRRRSFLGVLGGAAAWPLAARAQQRERMRRIGVLMNAPADDPEGQTRVAVFLQGLQQAGWAVGGNVQIDLRWGPNDNTRRRHATDLAALAPDAFLASGGSAVAALQQATRSVPIVFASVIDPVGAGFVESLGRPGGNITGFAVFEYGFSGKLLELLKEIAPRVTRVAVLRNPANPSGIGQFGVIQAMASSLAVEVSPINTHDANTTERAVAAFARASNSGLIVAAAGSLPVPRNVIITLAARHRLPVVYSQRVFVTEGGLVSYGPDRVDQYRRAAAYIDRILKGEQPGELPVQAPTRFELVVNLKTAKALELDVPPTLLARADEVIE